MTKSQFSQLPTHFLDEEATNITIPKWKATKVCGISVEK